MVRTKLYKSQALKWWHKKCTILNMTKSVSISIGLPSALLTFLLGIIGMEIASMDQEDHLMTHHCSNQQGELRTNLKWILKEFRL